MYLFGASSNSDGILLLSIIYECLMKIDCQHKATCLKAKARAVINVFVRSQTSMAELFEGPYLSDFSNFIVCIVIHKVRAFFPTKL